MGDLRSPVAGVCTVEAAIVLIAVVVATVNTLSFSWQHPAQRYFAKEAKQARDVDVSQASKQNKAADSVAAAATAAEGEKEPAPCDKSIIFPRRAMDAAWAAA